MTEDAYMALEFILSSSWRFFVSWNIPGTNVTPAMWFLFLLLAGLVLTMISRFLGVSWFGGK